MNAAVVLAQGPIDIPAHGSGDAVLFRVRQITDGSNGTITVSVGNGQQGRTQSGFLYIFSRNMELREVQATTETQRIHARLMEQHEVGGLVVTDDEVRLAMRFAFLELKLVIEPGGAANSVISTMALSGSPQSVALAVTGLPPDATATR
jgi:hypothetical protein